MIALDETRPYLSFKTEAWDRFIRNPLALRRHQDYVPKESTSDLEYSDAIINKQLYSYSAEIYRKMLAKALSVSIETKQWSPAWPVHHRINPCVNSPSAILDLPNIRNNFCSSVMDWSCKDYLTVAFPSSVYLWYAPKNTTVRLGVSNTMCVKWTRDGRNLFTASKRGTFKMSRVENENYSFATGKCICHCTCYITCCSFYPFSDLLVAGCSEGAFSVYYPEKDKSMALLYYQQDFAASITSVEFSCDGKHFAVASLTGSVGIYELMNKKVLFFIKMAGPTRALSWHPWDRTCLVVADCIGNMNLYDVLSPQALKASYTSVYNMPIVCLAFNPVSGELVVSHRLHGSIGDEPYSGTELNVLASFDRVVDRMEGHTGRVLCMNWSPDSTKLATCGSDETARIWSFLPQGKRNQSTQKEIESSYSSTVIKLGDRMGLSLR